MIERSGLRLATIELALALLVFAAFPGISYLLLVAVTFTLLFFRDPPRRIQDGVVSPADGRVDYVGERRIEIFMGPFDCHINRSPVDGVVTKTRYIRGTFPPAYNRSGKAERNEIYISTPDGEFKVVQVAGFFARRIVCYVGKGDFVRKGQKIGIIKFGSRVILEVPDGYRFVKSVGEKVKAGETIAVKACSAYCGK
ncbi:phosphatidylserine decarboxylase [Archaeoglobus veneficus]|uniref:Phosphatidylserine decarboxylase proenzyme n=1 Tax=Archaeoglobus veneficus (strain DSM 11195 / SNP6) TaxID=693661 RepID=F2KPK0_ARCVS|nr:phosphatidylserine decarboxylase [Archaeoglobus veneficus]AEA46431.1 Phosphatidylserine decarboxylase proenzyme [Archaeoglobus veneficus SNP6]